jgi:hypothetical protein
MSDVVVTVVESTTAVTVTEQDVAVAITETNVDVSTSTAGVQGAAGAGVASGGTAGQILAKVDGTNFNTTWIDNAAEQTLYLVRNNTGTTILKGTLLAASGAEPSGRIDVEPFVVTGLQDSELRVMGVATANISNGVNGTVMSFGTLVGVDTRGNVASALAVGDETWADGDILFAHPTVAGKLTKVRPQHDLAVAFITVRHASTGQIAIRIVPGNFHLEWLHDVSIISPTNNQVLTYDSASSLWVNANNPADGVTSITATAPLTGGTITSTGSIGLDQTALSITRSQVSNFTSGTVASADVSGTATFATTSGTATYATTSGTAVFATNASTAVTISGSIAQSQVTSLVSDLANTAKLNTANAFTVGGHVITAQSGAIVPLLLKGAVSHSGNLLEFQDSSSSVLARISPFGSFATVSRISVGQTSSFTAQLNVLTNSASLVGAIIQGAASQSADLLQIQSSAAANLLVVSSTGTLRSAGLISAGDAVNVLGQLSVTSTAASRIGAVIRGAASQTANIQEWQNSAGTVLGSVNSSGDIQTSAAILAGTSSWFSATSNIKTLNAAIVGQVIRGTASQTANLQEWQNSAGTVLAKVDSSGNISGTQLRTLNTYVTVSESNSGGSLRLLKGTAAAAPLANEVRLQVLTGTTINTLKLVAVGPNGTAVTILDNLA